MEQERDLAPIPSSAGHNIGMLVMLACMLLSWMLIHRWAQRNTKGPKTWPLVGAAIEQFMNYDRMHDWLLKYFSDSKTVAVPMPFTTYTYISDPYSMGRMEYNWGPDAASFKPERWLKEGYFQNASPFKFTAFQAGPRICLGKDSAYLQMKMGLAILCRFFKFTLVPEHPVKYRMMTILSMEHGLKVTAGRRF